MQECMVVYNVRKIVVDIWTAACASNIACITRWWW